MHSEHAHLSILHAGLQVNRDLLLFALQLDVIALFAYLDIWVDGPKQINIELIVAQASKDVA